MSAQTRSLAELDAATWDALLPSLGIDDAYYDSAYLESASLLGQGEPTFLRLEGDGGEVVFPCLVRDAPDGFSDVSTPMGYGGPLAAGAAPPVDEFFGAYDDWCSEERVVATFVRFLPTRANHELAHGRWHLEQVGHSVGWSVEGRDESALLAEMAGHHRRLVRKALTADLQARVERSPASLADFVALYGETMRRRNAAAFYLFPDAYWSQLAGPLARRLVRADAFAAGELIASILCLASDGELHYHLGASSEHGQALGANHFLFWRTAAWASGAGYRLFHLGGGVGGFEDSLYEFKRRFEPQGGPLPAYLGKAVHDEVAYRGLTGASTIEYSGYFPAYRRAS